MTQELFPPPEKVIEEVKRRLPRKIAKLEEVPRFLEDTALLLDDLNVRIQKLMELTESIQAIMPKIPEGLTYPIELTLTGNIITKYEMDKEPEAGSRAWYSATILSDGPDDCWVRANSPVGRYQKITEGEAVDIDFKAPLLKKLFFKCGSATATAALRILGEA